MQKRTIIILTIALLSIQSAMAQFEGTVGAGLHLGYATNIHAVGGGAHIHYYHTNDLRFAPSFTYYHKQDDKGMWMVDADAHYILPVTVTASLYPIVGLNFSQWKQGTTIDEGTILPISPYHRLGLNLGLGAQHDIGYRVRANYELKYQSIRGHAQVMFMAGFGFWF